MATPPAPHGGTAARPPTLQPDGTGPVWLSTSPTLARLPGLGAMLQARVHLQWPWSRHAGAQAVLAWGRKPSAQRAEALARRLGLPLVRLEDGFLRSFGTGQRHAPLSLVVDHEGIYYDSTRPSGLERLLNGPADLLRELGDQVPRAKALILLHRLSKYNHAPPLPAHVLRAGDSRRVLVVDQTAGDLSVRCGGADAATFCAMLAAAHAENPGATVYVKTHPEAVAGHKGGYLTSTQPGARTVVLRELVNPMDLIAHMDRVYVVSSTMGFEALLAGKPVTCFGLPWYAGWGATDDRQRCERRTRSRSVDELFAAAYFHQAHYLDPVTQTRGSIFDAIAWLVHQRERASQTPARLIAVGFPAWRRMNLKPLLALSPERVVFVRTAAQARALQPGAADALLCWGREAPPGVDALAQASGAPLRHLEDGFVRSVGLGSDLIPPHSLVMDTCGIYFDPSQPSDLERILGQMRFEPEELERAQRVRAFIVGHGITKYNLEPRTRASWPKAPGQRVVLVPGQVEDDASIRLGCTQVRTNHGLLQAAREAQPDAFIVYKPHPDVVSRNRTGRVRLAAARQWADHIETALSVVSCIDACDEVHTMTSLTGFDALLRGKQVVVYGQPFYAGWGLTTDLAGPTSASTRRERTLTLDELVAGTLLRYPLYWDWTLNGYTTCEAVLHRLLGERSALERSGRLEQLRSGWLRRQGRKLAVLARTLWSPTR